MLPFYYYATLGPYRERMACLQDTIRQAVRLALQRGSPTQRSNATTSPMASRRRSPTLRSNDP